MNREANDSVSYENAVFFAYAYEVSVALPAGQLIKVSASNTAPQQGLLNQTVEVAQQSQPSAGGGLRTVLGMDSFESFAAQRGSTDGLVMLSVCVALVSLAIFASRALSFGRA